jgi:hypothetical protein
MIEYSKLDYYMIVSKIDILVKDLDWTRVDYLAKKGLKCFSSLMLERYFNYAII